MSALVSEAIMRGVIATEEKVGHYFFFFASPAENNNTLLHVREKINPLQGVTPSLGLLFERHEHHFAVRGIQVFEVGLGVVHIEPLYMLRICA
jgi:hypothetical protein